MKIENLKINSFYRTYIIDNGKEEYDVIAISTVKENNKIVVIDAELKSLGEFESLEEVATYLEDSNYTHVEEIPFKDYNKYLDTSMRWRGKWVYEEVLPKIKVKEVKREVFKVSDGKVFINKEEAEKYEESLQGTRYYRIGYSPDLNETGRFMEERYVKVVELSKIKAREKVENWCLKKIGKKHAYIQGVSKTGNWGIYEVKKEDIGERKVTLIE